MPSHRILVIEDEPGAREALRSLLVDEGYTVATAGTGGRGLRVMGDFHPDTVVCDFHLPDTDGLQVMRQVREHDGAVTFIMVTAGCGGAEREAVLQREADFFFHKPIDLRRLRSALQQRASGGGAGPAARTDH